MTIEVYSFENKEGVPHDFTTQDADQARVYAQENGLKWIANIYEFSDSELVEDYTI